MNTHLHHSSEDELSLIDIGVIFYTNRIKIGVLTLLFCIAGTFIKGIPSQIEQVESLVKIGSYNSRFPIEDPGLFLHMVKYEYLPKVTSNKDISITTMAVDPLSRLMKLVTPVNHVDVDEIRQVHQKLMNEIVEHHNKMKARTVNGNELIYFSTPTEEIFVGRNRTIPAWNGSLFVKFLVIYFIAFLSAVVCTFAWDYAKKVRIASIKLENPDSY